MAMIGAVASRSPRLDYPAPWASGCRAGVRAAI